MFRIRSVVPHVFRNISQIRQASGVSAGAAEVKAEAAAERAEQGFKRFWKTAGVAETNDGYNVLLDKRPLKTPSGNRIVIPTAKKSLAVLVAAEWERQEKVLKPHSLPLTSLVSRSIDGLQDARERGAAIDKLMKFLETDTVCFQQSYPDTMVNLQQKYYDPLISWIQTKYNVQLSVTEQLVGAPPHPEETTVKLRRVVESMDPLTLAAFEKATIYAKSFIIALALINRQVPASFAVQASRVEVMTQIRYWGQVEDTHDVDEAQTEQQLGAIACMMI